MVGRPSAMEVMAAGNPTPEYQQRVTPQRGLRPPVYQHASRSCGDPSSPGLHLSQPPRSASYGGERSHSPVDPKTKAQISEFEEIIEQMDKYWPKRRAQPPPYPQQRSPLSCPQVLVPVARVPPPTATGIDEDLRVILNNMDPELLASSAPCGVKIEATPLPPSPNG